MEERCLSPLGKSISKVNKPSTPQLPDSANKDTCLPLMLPDGLDISIGMPTHINVKKIMKET